jgi:HlyD family secretion protein
VPIQSVTVRTLEQLGVEEATREGIAETDSSPSSRFAPDDDGFVEMVWVVIDDRAEARQVATGIQSDSHIEITDGLDEGERVVVGSYRVISRDLSDGAAVRLEAKNEAHREG